MDATPLRPVPADAPPTPPAAAPRREPRARPKKSLPTDRMKWDIQLRVLQTFGRLSGASKRVVSPERLSEALNNEVSHYTVNLSHAFFVDCGWLEKRGRGEYAAADPLVSYTNRLSVDPDNPESALSALRPSVRNAWFWRAIEGQIAGGAPIAEVIVTLMTEAEVGQEHRPQLHNIIGWLRYIRLVNVDHRGVVTKVDGAAPAPTVNDPEPDPNPEAEQKPEAEQEPKKTALAATSPAKPADTKGEVSTNQTPPAAAPVVSFGVSVTVTADDLSRLSQEQIKSLFEGIAAVAAIKEALTK